MRDERDQHQSHMFILAKHILCFIFGAFSLHEQYSSSELLWQVYASSNMPTPFKTCPPPICPVSLFDIALVFSHYTELMPRVWGARAFSITSPSPNRRWGSQEFPHYHSSLCFDLYFCLNTCILIFSLIGLGAAQAFDSAAFLVST